MSAKVGCIALCLIALGSQGFGQSLGEVAKKEKERRKKIEGETRVIDDQALAEAGSGGTPAETSVTVSGSDSDSDDPTMPPIPARADRASDDSLIAPSESVSPALRTDGERDRQKQRAIAALERHLSSMRGPAQSLIRAAMYYQQRCTGSNATNNCENEINQLARRAIVVGKMLDEAHNLARKSGVTPGELRDLREKHGLDNAVWDAAARFAAKYGR